MHSLLSFEQRRQGRGLEFEGALIAVFHLLITRKDKLRAIREAMFRTNLPNLANVFSTILIFCAVILFEHIKLNVGLMTTVSRQEPKPYEVKLFYTSTTPIIVQSTIVSQVCHFSRIASSRFPDSLVTKLLGVWQTPQQGLGDEWSIPVSGLAYYLQAPMSVRHTISDPIQTLVYLVFCLASAGIIAYYHVWIGGNSPADIAKQLKSQHLTIKGHREDPKAIEKKLTALIPTIATLGGILTGLLSFVADFIGAFGSGTGIIIAVSIIYQFAEELGKEWAKTGRALPF
jgi:protein transport protein SEC61 subunit alpha